MERKGLFTPDQEKLIADALDFFFSFNNVVIEKFDKYMFSILVKAIDNRGLDELKPAWKDAVIPVIDAALAKDYDKVRELAVTTIQTKLGDDMEYIVYDTFAQFIVSVIDFYIQKKGLKEQIEIGE